MSEYVDADVFGGSEHVAARVGQCDIRLKEKALSRVHKANHGVNSSCCPFTVSEPGSLVHSHQSWVGTLRSTPASCATVEIVNIKACDTSERDEKEAERKCCGEVPFNPKPQPAPRDSVELTLETGPSGLAEALKTK